MRKPSWGWVVVYAYVGEFDVDFVTVLASVRAKVMYKGLSGVIVTVVLKCPVTIAHHADIRTMVLD